ncbi:MAG: hypothetical protein K5989_12625 [Lachnospiraceae bacterium]|nr:hypothetical protein [Lachnospiraceae bacterium]
METFQGQRVTENIYFCPDGKYRWVYEFPMLKNPTILLTLFKIFGIICLCFITFLFIVEVFDDGFMDAVTGYLLDPGILIVPGILFVLILVGYFFLAAAYGWKYMVLFEMDENSVSHIQMPKQFQKGEALGWLSAMAGAFAGNYSAMGAGMLAASRNSMTSPFANVKKVIGKRWLHLIKVNLLLDHNQVYADEADYDFVWNFITSHCPNAKIKG